MDNVVTLRPAPIDWSIIGERRHELGVLAVALEHLRSPSEHFTLSPEGLMTLELLARRLKHDLDAMLDKARREERQAATPACG